MANKEHLAILKKGVGTWNTWMSKNRLTAGPYSGPDLRQADLRQADLMDADFEGADLWGANLIRANLRQARFDDADLSEADLSEADLNNVYLSGTNLRKANLRKANLSGVFLRRANLSEADMNEADFSEARFSGDVHLIKANFRGANFRGASMEGMVFADTNLSCARGLESCRHTGPSIIDYRTIQKSSLPFSFLRGCGLPDNLIDYLPSLWNQAIQFYSLFISYSHKDEEFAQRLHADLQAKGVRCWFARHEIKAGRKIHEQIDEAIRIYDRLLLILSPDSMNSEWVKTEIAHARQKEKISGRQVLFPISLIQFDQLRQWKCFDADIGKDSAREIREYLIPDFSRWKEHDNYAETLDRLIRDLKAD